MEMAAIRDRLKPGVKIELWFQDECRIGQKNKITRRWAAKSRATSTPHRQSASALISLRKMGISGVEFRVQP